MYPLKNVARKGLMNGTEYPWNDQVIKWQALSQ